MKIKNWKDKLYSCLLLGLILVLWYIFLRKCLFVWLFGIECPGCGMTRAYLALLRFDLKTAFSMHPMFWSVPILGVYYFFDWKIFKAKWIDYTILALIFGGFFINWLVKLCL